MSDLIIVVIVGLFVLDAVWSFIRRHVSDHDHDDSRSQLMRELRRHG